MKQKRKDLDSILKALDSIKNSATNPYKKVNEVLTRKGLTSDYFLDLENTLIADSYAAVDKSSYTKGTINNLAISYPGSKFISKGGYVVEHKKDNAFKTDLFFKILTATFTIATIGLTIWTKILDDKNTNDKKELNNKIELMQKENIDLQNQLLEVKQKLSSPKKE